MTKLEKRMLRGDIIAALQYLKYRKAGEGLFRRAFSDMTRGNGFQLEEIFRLDIREKLVTVRVVRH